MTCLLPPSLPPRVFFLRHAILYAATPRRTSRRHERADAQLMRALLYVCALRQMDTALTHRAIRRKSASRHEYQRLRNILSSKDARGYRAVTPPARPPPAQPPAALSTRDLCSPPVISPQHDDAQMRNTAHAITRRDFVPARGRPRLRCVQRCEPAPCARVYVRAQRYFRHQKRPRVHSVHGRASRENRAVRRARRVRQELPQRRWRRAQV